MDNTWQEREHAFYVHFSMHALQKNIKHVDLFHMLGNMYVTFGILT